MNASSIHTAPCILHDAVTLGMLHHSFTTSAAAENTPHDLLSKADFLHAVEDMSNGLVRSEIEDMEAVSLACHYGTWKHVFGEPRNVQEYRGGVSQPSVEVWEQPCSDGTVHCVGYFVNDPQDGQCVVLTRVCLF